jgi:hypothetical protein
MMMRVFVDCQFRKMKLTPQAFSPLPLRQGERIEVRGFESMRVRFALEKTLTLPLSLEGRGDPHY